MTDNERELLNIIRSHHNPERALETAINLLVDFSAKHEVPQDTSSEHLPESA